MSETDPPLEAEVLLEFADRIETLPVETASWVSALFQECLRARLHEAELLAAGNADTSLPEPTACLEGDAELAQVALDVAEWLKTLWDVGYMGAGSFPAAPRSAFPRIELEDVFQSALFARIRQGQRPLPFPPPTRHGRPWHALLEGEADTPQAVSAELIQDSAGQSIGVQIEGDSGWQIVETSAATPLIVQHRGRGPRFRLEMVTPSARLTRLAPEHRQSISLRERGGIRSFTLDWSLTGQKPLAVPLRAATWERAESEAAHWIATQHPELYGRVAFLRADNTVQ